MISLVPILMEALLTKWSSTVDPIRSKEEPLTERHSIKYQASQPHCLLLLMKHVEPFPPGHLSSSPQCELIKFTSQVNKGDRVSVFTTRFRRDNSGRWGRKILGERVFLRQRLPDCFGLWTRRLAVQLVRSSYEQQFEGYRL